MSTSAKDIWDRSKRLTSPDVYLETEGGARIAVLPTVLGNGLLKFILRLYIRFYSRKPQQQLSAEEMISLAARAWFGLPRDMRLEISESFSIGWGLVFLSVIAVGVGAVHAITFALNNALRLHLQMAVLCLVVARVSHVLGVEQTLSGLNLIGAVLESNPPASGGAT